MRSWAALQLQPSTSHEVFPLGREEGLGARGDPQALGLPFSAMQGWTQLSPSVYGVLTVTARVLGHPGRAGDNSAVPTGARCPHGDCRSPWPSCSLSMPCRNLPPTMTISKLLFQLFPPSTAQKGCSAGQWHGGDSVTVCLQTTPCAKDTLPVKNSL